MKYGTGFGLAALPDTTTIRDFAQTLDGAGFNFVSTSGHLLSAPPDAYPGRPLPTYAGPFHEPFVLFSYLAGITQQIDFLTSILILPLFQTAVIAKQAAELSILSGGRLQLGVAISWNEAEYEAVGQDFHTRGRRLAEQITLLRKLWTEPFVTFEGRWHKVENVGLYRLPEAPIPIWFGGGTDEKVLRRAARLGDGWIPLGDPTETLPCLRSYLAEYGRDPSTFRLMGRLQATDEGPSAWLEAGKKLLALGVTHVNLSAPATMSPAAALPRIIEARTVLAEELGGD